MGTFLRLANTYQALGNAFSSQRSVCSAIVSISCALEIPRLRAGCYAADVADYTTSAMEAPSNHKLFIFKGLLLMPAAKLNECGVRDNSVLHLILNDDPYRGR